MTVEQVELMCADTSVTVYPRHNEKKAKGEKREFRDIPQEELEAKAREWNERYGGGRHIVSLKL